MERAAGRPALVSARAGAVLVLAPLLAACPTPSADDDASVSDGSSLPETGTCGPAPAARDRCGERIEERDPLCAGLPGGPYRCFDICDTREESCFTRPSCCADSCEAFDTSWRGCEREGIAGDRSPVTCEERAGEVEYASTPLEAFPDGSFRYCGGTHYYVGVDQDCCTTGLPAFACPVGLTCATTATGHCCARCELQGTRCESDEECCSGRCVDGTCRLIESLCVAAGGGCETTGACCEGACVESVCRAAMCEAPGGGCAELASCCAGRCETGQCCGGSRTPCATDAECCAGTCLPGELPGEGICCEPPDAPCNNGGVCCRGSCQGTPGSQRCVCQSLGQSCVRPSDCCTGTCQLGVCALAGGA